VGSIAGIGGGGHFAESGGIAVIAALAVAAFGSEAGEGYCGRRRQMLAADGSDGDAVNFVVPLAGIDGDTGVLAGIDAALFGLLLEARFLIVAEMDVGQIGGIAFAEADILLFDRLRFLFAGFAALEQGQVVEELGRILLGRIVLFTLLALGIVGHGPNSFLPEEICLQDPTIE
jgi:hypothetical protein